MRRPTLRIALLIALVAFAGSSSGVGGGAPAAPSAGGGDALVADAGTADGEDGLRRVSLENSSLDLPADRVFAEVEALVAENASQPEVTVLIGESAGSGAFSHPYTPYGFVEDMALTDVGSGGDSAAGITDAYGSVYLVAGNATTAQHTTFLVHEYVHTIQRRASLLPWDPTSLTGDVPTDGAQTKLALTEGAAVWVTDRYIERHVAPNATLQSEQMARGYEEARVGGRYFLARYHFGATAVDRRIDEPSQLPELYEGEIPETTEQLLHGYTPAQEPMDPLTVAASGGDGWAYDRLVEFERDDPAYAWVTRWDDPANASEFASAFETYAAGLNTNETRTFGIERLGDDVVIVYSGPPAFVDAATATRENKTVRVGVEA